MVTRGSQAIDATTGRASVVTTDYPYTSGVVQTLTNLELWRLPEGERQEGQIAIWTRFDLTSGAGATDADIVTWRGRKYVVCQVDDWSEYGLGYIRARCKLLQLNP